MRDVRLRIATQPLVGWGMSAVGGLPHAVKAIKSMTIDATIRMNREACAKLERPIRSAAFFLLPCVRASHNGYAAARRSAGTWIQR